MPTGLGGVEGTRRCRGRPADRAQRLHRTATAARSSTSAAAPAPTVRSSRRASKSRSAAAWWRAIARSPAMPVRASPPLLPGFNGNLGDSIVAAGSHGTPVNHAWQPTFASIACSAPTASSAVNFVLGLPGPVRLQVSGRATENGTSSLCAPTQFSFVPFNPGTRARFRLDRHGPRYEAHERRQSDGRHHRLRIGLRRVHLQRAGREPRRSALTGRSISEGRPKTGLLLRSPRHPRATASPILEDARRAKRRSNETRSGSAPGARGSGPAPSPFATAGDRTARKARAR